MVAQGVAADGSGHVAMSGWVSGSSDFGAGPLAETADYSVFLAEYAQRDGALLWAKRFAPSGTNANAIMARIAPRPSGGFLIVVLGEGIFDFGGGPLSSGADAGPADAATHIVAAAFEADGSLAWSRRLTRHADGGIYGVTSVATASDGGFVIAGELTGKADFGGGPIGNGVSGSQSFVASYDPTGAPRWARILGSTAVDNDAVGAIDFDDDGSVVVPGTIGKDGSGVADFGGGPVMTHGGGDAYVAVYGPDGAYRWAALYGGPNATTATSVAVVHGNIFVAGTFADVLDLGAGPMTAINGGAAFVARLTKEGHTVWSRALQAPPLGGRPTTLLVAVDKWVGYEDFPHGPDIGGTITIGATFSNSWQIEPNLVLTSAGHEDIMVGEMYAAAP
jgi:hypothetical protein